MECLRLRVQDVDFAASQITVHDGKGAKDRLTMLSQAIKTPLTEHLKNVRMIHQRDLQEGLGQKLTVDWRSFYRRKKDETIEHVLPQGETTLSVPYWGTRFSEESWKASRHRLGNLCLRACGPQPEGARRRAGICFVAAPRRCTLTSLASRRLASARPALAPKCKRYSLTGPYRLELALPQQRI